MLRPCIRLFAEHHSDWFTFKWLPSYSPQLNSVEQSSKRTKYDDLPNFIPDNVDHLHDNVYKSQENQHRDQTILRSFLGRGEGLVALLK